jgi:beta-lactamase superfamily II metal-dependent hydrolase
MDRLRWCASLLAVVLLPASVTPLAAQVELTFLDVGQGDAAFIRTPEGQVALVDGGPFDIVNRLRGYDIASLELVIASHGHEDHIGGLPGVLRSLPVQSFMHNQLPASTMVYGDLMAAVHESDVRVIRPAGQTLQLGSVALKVLPMSGLDGQNNNSIGIVVQYGEFQALLTGDSEIEALNFWLDRGMPDVTLLKAAHHGARDAVSPRWVDVTRPEVVVISAGAGNSYGHPHPWALRYYNAVADVIYRTDLHGDVTVIGNRDGTYEVRTGRRAPAAPIGPPVDVRRPVQHPARAPVTLMVFPDAPGNDHYNLNGEYVVITNDGTAPLVTAGWRLCDAANHCFTFPRGTRIVQRLTVYTGSGVADESSLYAGFRRAVWNNGGDVATLFDESGRIVARLAY